MIKLRRAMSSLRKGAPPPRMKKKSPDPVISNGNSNPSLYYPNDPPDDENMNEIADENVDLTVLLPEGKVKDTSVNSNIPMMDLLVNLAARNKLSPAGYTIVVLNEETRKPMDYKPNQTVGSLCPKTVDKAPRHLTVQLVPKKGDSEKQRNTKNAQPFEMTYRFTVNLPKNQKKVLRVSPATPLEDIHRQICSEKNLDPFRYTFQLPSDPYSKLSMQMTVGEIKSNEINLTGTGSVNSAMSMPNLSVDRSQPTKTDIVYMPTLGETKKKKGFFSFLKKDNSKKFSLQSVQRDAFVEQPISSREIGPTRSISQESPPARRKLEGNPGVRPKTMYAVVKQPISSREIGPTKPTSQESPPARRKLEGNPGVRPKAMYAVSTSNLDKISDAKTTVPPLDLSGLNNSQNASSKSKSLSALKTVNESDKVLVAPPRKKRRAPPPPQAQAQSVQNTVQVEISVEKTNLEKMAKSKVETNEIKQRTENVSKFHSRNSSSDSSGYHESTLSGAESPDGPRIDKHFEVNLNLETASLDSGGHLNGDSGIRDISPSSSRRTELDGDVGSSQTLPLERTRKKGEASSTPRSNSLDRTEKKKKAAPPPPGSPPQPPVTTSTSIITSTVPAQKTKKKDDSIAISAVLDSLDQNLDDNDTSGSGMMMVENSSIHSEDIDVDQSTLLSPPRPCAFIAPPPPSEPPPDDTEPVDYNMIMNGRVDTVDVGVETSDDSASYDPVSTRSSTESPVSMHSRAESRTSISSVNTVDDVSMDFERTIAVCEEEVMRAEKENPEYKTEMAHFVERMKEMTVDGELNKKQKTNKDLKIDEPSIDGKVDDAVYIFPQDDDETVEMENIPQTLKESEMNDSPRDEKEENKNVQVVNSNREVSEITYDFKIHSVPPEFQSEMEAPDEVQFEKGVEEKVIAQEEEEEELITETVEIIYPFIEPLVEPKSETVRVENVPKKSQNIVLKEKPVVKRDETIIKENRTVDIKPVTKIKMEEKIIPPEPEKPKEKEEFVLTFDDLSNVDFSLMRKKKKIVPKPKPAYQSTPEKNHFAINNDKVYITPCKEHNIQMDDGSILTDGGSIRGHKGEVKTKCSELSFSPNSEGEMENVLEEKSISMINLPAVRNSRDNSVAVDDNSKDDNIVVSRTEIVFSMNSNSDNNYDQGLNRKLSTNSNLEKSVNDSGVEAGYDDSSLVDQQEVLAAQHKQLQQQFSIWQTQLEENKKLLLTTHAIPADDTNRQFQQQLQSQIQLQQQMIQQMQQSMEALSSQQQQQQIISNIDNQSSHNTADQSETSIGNHIEHKMEQKVEKQVENGVPPVPQAPALANGKIVINAKTGSSSSNEQIKPKARSKSKKYIEPKLDPREELMIAIKNFGGRTAMKKVPVNQTHWHAGIP